MTADIYTGFNDVSHGGRFCDEEKFDVPFRSEYKLAGNYPLPYGLDVGAVLQSYAGTARGDLAAGGGACSRRRPDARTPRRSF